MFTFYRENGILYTETKFDLVRPVTVNGVKYEKSEKTSFEDVELVRRLLLINANVLICKKPGAEFEKPSLYDFSMALEEKTFNIIDGLPTRSEVLKNAFKECVNMESDIKSPDKATDMSESFKGEEIEEDDEEEVDEENKSNNQNNHQGKNRKKRNNNSQQEDGDK